jgi:serine O-acetyltransferase
MLGRLLRKKEKYSKPLTPEQEAYFKTDQGRAELEAYFKTPEGAKELREAILEEIHQKGPTLQETLPLDAALYESLMLEPLRIKQGLPLLLQIIQVAWKSDAFLCLLLYRIRVRLRLRKVPLVPTVLHRLCMIIAQVDIGEKAVLHPGVYIPHGQVVIDGQVEIGTGTSIAPWVTIGLDGHGVEGPTIGPNVLVGTGAKVLGRVTIGGGARIGANSVVLKDVETNTTVAGAPAKMVRDRRNEMPEHAPSDGKATPPKP